ncbi:MAG: DUF4349 domain-containing protein [Lachnospiraceae bacterium]|nr:DUF4349 domain-containing protein [Lachnospiraceae bacterium]
MRKRKQIRSRLFTVAGVAASVLLAAGCGGSSGGMMMEEAKDAAAYVTNDVYMQETAAQTMEAEAGSGGESGSATPRVQESSRKLIRNVSLNVETETFDDLMKAVTEKTESFGGYVEESSTYNGSYYYGGGTRNASLVLRIPSEKLDEFLGTVAQISNVVSRDENVTDVTLQYVDMKSHKDALLVEQKRLLELLEKAESVEDIIAIESRLSDVRYQIESMESQLRTLDNQVSYSTVRLYIDEVAKLTPIKEQTTLEKIKTGFAQSLYNIGSGAKNLMIGLVIYLPYIVLWAVILIIALFVWRFLHRRRSGLREEKEKGKKQKVEQKEEKNE